MELTEEVINLLKNPYTVKYLTTVDEEGIPNTVFKGSLTALDKNTIAYVELIENSLTQRNMLKNFWYNKRPVSISIFNPGRNISYQIKGEPYKFVVEGEIWKDFLNRVRSIIPDVNPSGVWLIRPKEIINQNYNIKKTEISEKKPGFGFWHKYVEGQ
jgi:hypothetical protein